MAKSKNHTNHNQERKAHRLVFINVFMYSEKEIQCTIIVFHSSLIELAVIFI